MSADTMESPSPPEQERLPIQDHFLGWQCRVRAYAMRQDEGRPSTGMRPRVVLEDGAEVASAVTLLLLPSEPQEHIQQFRYMVQKTHDPQERYKKAVQLLSSTFYQHIEDFSGMLTGLFLKGSDLVMMLVKEERCVLEFNYQQQRFTLPCRVGVLPKRELAHQFTFWHNHLFNPNIPPEIKVLGFEPEWPKASADPELDQQ